MKFEKRKELDLVSAKPVWIFEAQEKDALVAFQIRASHEGVWMQGPSPIMRSRGDLDVFAKTLSTAWKEHQNLRPAFVTTLAGH